MQKMQSLVDGAWRSGTVPGTNPQGYIWLADEAECESQWRWMSLHSQGRAATIYDAKSKCFLAAMNETAAAAEEARRHKIELKRAAMRKKAERERIRELEAAGLIAPKTKREKTAETLDEKRARIERERLQDHHDCTHYEACLNAAAVCGRRKVCLHECQHYQPQERRAEDIERRESCPNVWGEWR